MSKVKDAGPFERILTLAIGEDDIAAGKKTAARRLASEVKVKGFRPGKAPLQVVESVVGADTLRREAIDDALPALVTAAIADTDLEPSVPPRLENIRDEDDGVEVDVLITLWPTLKKLPKYKGRKVEVSTPVVSDTDVEDQIERMRNQFADLEDVEREAFEGDFVIVDVTTSKDGEDFAGGSATDMLFEVGAGMFLEGMDDALRGKGAGAIEQFSSTLPQSFGDDGGADVDVRVLVKQVKTKRLPELTDEWVDDMTEFETVTEMQVELRAQLIKIKHSGARVEFERVLLEQLIESLDLELPEALSDAEMDSVFHRFAHRLEQQGIELSQYLSITGQDQATFVSDLRSQADVNLKTRVLLEAVAAAEELSVDESEMESTVAELAEASKMEIGDYKRALAEGGQENALSGDILRRKAVDRLLELAVPVDGDGNELDLSPEDEDGADGDGAPENSGGTEEPAVTADADDAPADTDTE